MENTIKKQPEIRLTWEEMKEQYPDQWLFVADPEEGITPEIPYIKSGFVILAHEDKRELYKLINQIPIDERMTTVVFTGIIKNETHAWRLVSFSRDQIINP